MKQFINHKVEQDVFELAHRQITQTSLLIGYACEQHSLSLVFLRQKHGVEAKQFYGQDMARARKMLEKMLR